MALDKEYQPISFVELGRKFNSEIPLRFVYDFTQVDLTKVRLAKQHMEIMEELIHRDVLWEMVMIKMMDLIGAFGVKITIEKV